MTLVCKQEEIKASRTNYVLTWSMLHTVHITTHLSIDTLHNSSISRREKTQSEQGTISRDDWINSTSQWILAISILLEYQLRFQPVLHLTQGQILLLNIFYIPLFYTIYNQGYNGLFVQFVACDLCGLGNGADHTPACFATMLIKNFQAQLLLSFRTPTPHDFYVDCHKDKIYDNGK